MSRLVWSIAVVLAAALTGCTASHVRNPGQSTSQSSSATSSTGTSEPIPPPVMNETSSPKILLSQCTGFVAVNVPSPRAVAPGQAPPGWEAKDPSVPLSYVYLAGYDCKRINVDKYERGPIRIVWDGHDHADIPSHCSMNTTTQGPHLAVVLNSMLVNDSEIATYLQSEFGLPVRYGEIGVAGQPVNDFVKRTWTWGVGQGNSDLNLLDDGTNQTYDRIERLYWQRGNGIGVMDLTYERWSHAVVADRPAYGSMAPPMLLASTPAAQFTGTASYFPAMSGEGLFALYKDLQCKEPEPFGSSTN